MRGDTHTTYQLRTKRLGGPDGALIPFTSYTTLADAHTALQANRRDSRVEWSELRETRTTELSGPGDVMRFTTVIGRYHRDE